MKEPEKTSPVQQVENYFDQFSFLKDKKKLSLTIPQHLKIELYEEEGGFIFNSQDGFMYTLNPTSTFLLSFLLKNSNKYSFQELVQTMTEEFDVPLSEASDDLIEFFCRLKDFGVEISHA